MPLNYSNYFKILKIILLAKIILKYIFILLFVI